MLQCCPIAFFQRTARRVRGTYKKVKAVHFSKARKRLFFLNGLQIMNVWNAVNWKPACPFWK